MLKYSRPKLILKVWALITNCIRKECYFILQRADFQDTLFFQIVSDQLNEQR